MRITFPFLLILFFSLQSVAQKGSLRNPFPDDTIFHNAHAGVYIEDASTGKALVNYQSDKFFVPASNLKILSTYIALKELGDSLTGLRYLENDTAVFIRGTGDPGFLHPLFQNQPVFNFLRSVSKPIYIDTSNWRSTPYGSGWSWDDYSESYLPERSAFPIYGNVIRWLQERTGPANPDETDFDQSVFIYSIPEMNWDVRFNPAPDAKEFKVKREFHRNAFYITQGSKALEEVQVPFITNGFESALELIRDTLGKAIQISSNIPQGNWLPVYSRPIDSILKPMLKESDNFFAEQLLIMVSEKRTGIMDDESLRDSLLNNELSFIKNKVGWADGSGLSRYNLFTPMDMVNILDATRNEFGMDRIKRIYRHYPLSNGNAYAKTGTLSGVVAFSGFLVKRNGRELVFSILVNNHRASASAVRKRIFELLEKM